MQRSNIKKVISEYRQLASSYDSHWKKYLAKTFEVAFKLGNIKQNDVILDVSGGTGLFASSILNKVGANIKITIIDVTDTMLKTAHKKFSKKNNVKIISHDVHKLPFKNEEFSKTFCISAFHYYYKADDVLSEIRRVLKKKGQFILIDWCNDSIYFKIFDLYMRIFTKAHCKTYTSKQLISLIKNGDFRIEKVTKFRAGLWPMIAIKASKI